MKQLLQNSNLERSERLKFLEEIALYSSDPEEKIIYSEKVLELLNADDRQDFYINALLNIGVSYRLTGELEKSLEYLFKSSEVAFANTENILLAESYVEIATTYTKNSDQKNALIYSNKAIKIFKETGNFQKLAINLLNTGFIYFEQNKFDSALLYYNEAGPLFDSVNLTIGKAYNLGNRALVYWKTGAFEEAEQDLLLAIDMLVPLGDQYGMADFHNQLGNLYLETGQTEKSIIHTQKSLEMAEALGLKEQARDASLVLSKLSAERRNFEEAYRLHQEYLAYRDSIQNEENTKAMADQRTEFEVSIREKEIEVLEKDKQLQNIYIIVALVFLLVFILLYLLSRQRLITNKLASKAERDQHEKDVQNLLQGQEKKTLQSMIEGREKERKHLAGELHNHLGSLLATVKMNLNGFEQEDQRINTLHQLVDQVYNDVRDMSHALNMGVSEDFGLVSALQELVDHLSQSGKLKIEFNAAVTDCFIPFEQEIVLYRVVQELVSNVLKHAQATEMTLLLTCFEDEQLLNIMVADNGQGFDTENAKVKADGMGLHSLDGMVSSLHGEMEIDSQAGKGTTINIDFPLDDAMTENPLTQ
ncbi:MAG: tetratricopeptide repeat protein [Cytophagales bacterium]|nr:tetratricopeptide repeat protein [Cytophagales bacterium]